MMTPQRNEPGRLAPRNEGVPPSGRAERPLSQVEGGTPSLPGGRPLFQRAALVSITAVVCFGCAAEEPPPPPISVELAAAIAAPEEIDPAATVHLSVHHAWTGTGELRYPLEIVQRWETNLGSSNFSFDYPSALGEGLVVYAWVDADGDGSNCTPAERGDLADLVEVEAFPSEQVSASLFLDAPCAGPDWFFPGPEPEPAAPPESAPEESESPEAEPE